MEKRFLKINLGLFLIGAILSFYLVVHHYQLLNGENVKSFCSINEKIDCNVVNSSKYADLDLLGIQIPIATIALSYFTLAILLCLIALWNAYSRREALIALLSLSSASVLVSVAFAYISLIVLKNLCIFCSAIQILSILTFILVLIAAKQFGFTQLSCKLANRKKLVVFSALGLFIFIVSHLLTRNFFYDPMPIDMQQFLTEYRSQPVFSIDPAHSPHMGFEGKNPLVQIIEFADFQCPLCGKVSHYIERLVQNYGNKVQMVFKNYPLDQSCNPHVSSRMHEHACMAAKSVYCAHLQGKFAQMYHMAFNNQTSLSEENFRTWAKQLRLDVAKFEQCSHSQEAEMAIQKDIATGEIVGVNVTPTFFVNGRKIEGVLTEEMFRALLQELK